MQDDHTRRSPQGQLRRALADDDSVGVDAPPPPTGEQIVAAMAAGRAWWMLRASDAAPWIRHLPVSARTNKYNRIGWLGRPWDGHNDLPVGEWPWDGDSKLSKAEPLVDNIEAWAVVPGHEMKRLVMELRRLIGGMPELGVALPNRRDVRATLVGREGSVSDPTSAMAVIDFDFGGMILPLGIDDWQLRPNTWTLVEEVAASMVEALVQTTKHRRKLLRRDRKMREGFKRDVSTLGGRAAPLWLRMEPLRFDRRISEVFRLPYVAHDIRLDIHQVWSPEGIERVASPSKLRRIYAQDG